MSHQLPAQASITSTRHSVGERPLARAHHLPGPAAFLSPDVLETVFMFAAASNSDDDDKLPLLRRAPINVSHVNRHWRWFSLGRNGLWTTFKSIITTELDMRHAARDITRFETFLSRSGSVLPLKISILFNPIADWEPETETEDVSTIWNMAAYSMCRYMSLIMPVRHRLRTARLLFRLEGPESAPSGVWPWNLDNMSELEHLVAGYPFIGEDDDPGIIDLSACSERIRTCDISGCLEIRIAKELNLSNLEVLKIDIPGHCSNIETLARSWYNALGRMPKLSHLSVVIHDGLNWDLHLDFSIDLPKLEELRVRFTTEVEDQSPESPYEFLNNLSCPNLKNLKINCDYIETPEERNGFCLRIESIGLYQFLRDNGGELESLVIGYDLFFESELLNALVRCTNLRQLQFRDMLFAEDSELLKVLHLERRLQEGVLHDEDIPRPYCPELECLEVSRCYIPDTIQASDIVDMIVGRREKEGSKFKYFELEGCNLEGLGENPRIRAICEVIEDEVTP